MGVFLLLCAVLVAQAAPKQEGNCGESYENHNQVEYKPLKLAVVQGTGVIEIEDNVVKKNEPVSGACLSLFTSDEKFIMSVKADAAGDFRFKNIAAGQYRLVARAPGFCTANIPVEIVRASRRSKLRRAQIVVHYRLTGIDVCSFGVLGGRIK